MKKLAERLKELRKNTGLNQTIVAQSLNLPYFTLGKWEQGRAEPSADDLVRLADYYDVSVDYLLGREDDFGVIRSQNAAPALDKDEQELIENFRELNRLQKQKILAYTEGMLAAERQYTKK